MFLHLPGKTVWPYPEYGHVWAQQALCRVGEEKCKSDTLRNSTRMQNDPFPVLGSGGKPIQLSPWEDCTQNCYKGFDEARKIIFPRASYSEVPAFHVMMCPCTGRVTRLGFALGFPCCCGIVCSPGGILADVTQEAVGYSCFQMGGHLQPPLTAASCLYKDNDLSWSERLRRLLMDAEAF